MSGLDPLLASALLAGLVGIVMGLFGGGGSLLSVPMLLYVTKLETHAAIAVSLFMVSAASAVGAVVHARAGRVRVRSASVFAISATLAAFAGGFVARWFPEWLLLSLFSLLMLWTAVRMIRPGKTAPGPARASSPALLAASGALTGFIAGLVGAGGGFLVVPALVLLAGLEIHEAVGTSLFVIAFSSLAGFLGHALELTIQAPILAAVTLPSLLGVVLGARFSERVPSAALRFGFGALIFVIGVFLLGEQLRLLLDG